jgi:hypothetical protein
MERDIEAYNILRDQFEAIATELRKRLTPNTFDMYMETVAHFPDAAIQAGLTAILHGAKPPFPVPAEFKEIVAAHSSQQEELAKVKKGYELLDEYEARRLSFLGRLGREARRIGSPISAMIKLVITDTFFPAREGHISEAALYDYLKFKEGFDYDLIPDVHWEIADRLLREAA